MSNDDIHSGEFTSKALEQGKEDIYRNILIDAYDLCKYSYRYHSKTTNDKFKFSSQELQDVCYKISTWPSHFILEDPSTRLTRSVAVDISKLWNDQAMQNAWLERKRYSIMDNTPYFLDKILEIIPKEEEKEYEASFEDLLRIYDSTTGIIVKRFRSATEFGEYQLEVTDVGGARAERRKWFRLFDNVSCVIYAMSLSKYDEFVFEDNTANCWDETLRLFEKTSHEKVFDKCDWVIIFNKVDLFEKKILEVPFTVYKPEFNELYAHDSVKVKEYIRDEFIHRFYDGLSKERKKKRGNLYFHVVCAIKVEDIGRILQKIQIDLIKSQMKKIGYLL